MKPEPGQIWAYRSGAYRIEPSGEIVQVANGFSAEVPTAEQLSERGTCIAESEQT